jgi:hypothetical protein
MQANIIIGYRQLIGGEKPDFEELIRGIPTRAIVAYYSAINNILEFRGNSREDQIFIYGSISHLFEEKDRRKHLIKWSAVLEADPHAIIFSTRHITSFIYKALQHYKDEVQEYSDSSEFIKVFKAYLLHVDEINDNDTIHTTQVLNEVDVTSVDGHRKAVWTTLANQFEYNFHSNPIYDYLKGRAFISFLKNNAPYANYFQRYISSLEVDNPYVHVDTLFNLAMVFKNVKDRLSYSQFIQLFTIPDAQRIYSDLILNPANLKLEQIEKLDLVDLKEKPLVQFTENQVVVSYWGFIWNAMYLGFLFKFYNQSGISDVIKSRSDFINHIAYEFTDQTIFKNLLRNAFNSRHDQVGCQKSAVFNPDFYYRQGTDVFIFELKDTLINKEVLHSHSYESILNAVISKLASKGDKKRGKGIYQLSRNIQLLNSQDLFWEIDELAKRRKIKLRNLRIFPILVHTNKIFDMPGINNLLDEMFKRDISVPNNLQYKIEDLTIINFEYFFDSFLHYRERKIKLAEEIRSYHLGVKKRWKKSVRSIDMNDQLAIFPSFHEYHFSTLLKRRRYKISDFLKEIRCTWDIGI